jgi:C-terminal peptidase prc
MVFGKQYEELMNEETNINIVDKMLKADIHYISFPVFTQNMGSQFVKAVSRIDKPQNKTLVIDLRNNPGGAINSANEMLDILLGQAKTSSLVARNGKAEAYDSDKYQMNFRKIIIMVNENSASSSELLALSLRKHLNNVTIIGHPTFGKGVGQSGFENKNKKYAIYLTSFYWNVENQNISGSRITPDIIVKGSGDKDYFDLVYKLTNLKIIWFILYVAVAVSVIVWAIMSNKK